MLTPDERRSLRESESRHERSARRLGAGCVWVGFIGSMVLGVAGAVVLVWLAISAIGWLNRH